METYSSAYFPLHNSSLHVTRPYVQAHPPLQRTLPHSCFEGQTRPPEWTRSTNEQGSTFSEYSYAPQIHKLKKM